MKIKKYLQNKTTIIAVFLLILHSLVFMSSTIFNIDTSKINKLLTYNHNSAQYPETLSYTPLIPEKIFTTEIKAPLNFFGAINLYFKPRENIYKTSLLEEGLEEPEDTKIQTQLDNRTLLLIKILDKTSNKYIVDTNYEIYYDKSTTFTYPFGFPSQKYSRNKSYQIFVQSIENKDSPIIFDIATQKNDLYASSLFHIPAHLINENKFEVFYFILFRLLATIQKHSLLILAFGINTIFILRNKKKKYKIAFLLNLIFFTAIHFIYQYISIIRNTLFAPTPYLLFSTLCFGFIYLINRPKNKEKKLNRPDSTHFPFIHMFIILIASIIYLFFILQYWLFIPQGEIRWLNLRGDEPILVQGYDDFNPELIKSTYSRCEAYWLGYLNNNLKATYNNTNPNATLCFLHLPTYLLKNRIGFNNYIYASRITMIIHNLIFAFLIYFFSYKLLSRNQALIVFIITLLNPLYIGYSKVFNHDSIQGLYSISFTLSILVAFKTKNRKFFIYAGILFALALLTQYKSQYIVPLLFVLPLIYSFISKESKTVSYFLNNLPIFYISSVLTALIIMPAIIFFPQFIIERFLFYQNRGFLFPATSLAIIAVVLSENKQFYRKLLLIIKKCEKFIVRIFILSLLSLIFFSLRQKEAIFNFYFYQLYTISFTPALWGAIVTIFYMLPLIILVLLALWILKYAISPKIDFSLLFTGLFFTLLVLLAATSRTNSNQHGSGFLILGSKYIFILLPYLSIGIAANSLFSSLPKKTILLLTTIIIISLVEANQSAKPFFHNYSNPLLPKGQLIQRNSWGVDSGIVSEYLNKNFSNIKVYHPKGTLQYPLIKKDIEAINWGYFFWEHEPDLLVITWDKPHRFAKILDYYRNNLKPIWSIKKNEAIYVGIYKFDPTLEYEKLFRQTINLNSGLQYYY